MNNKHKTIQWILWLAALFALAKTLKKLFYHFDKYNTQIKNISRENTVMKEVLLKESEDVYFDNYFKLQGYDSVIIYGAGVLGQHLYHTITQKGIEVKFFIDSYEKNNMVPVPVYIRDEVTPAHLTKGDVVVVCAIPHFKSIKKDLSDNFDCTVISYEEVVYLC